MNVLVVHQNFPGQFPHIVAALIARGDRVAAIGGPTATARPNVDLRRWRLKRGTTPGIFDPATRAEADLIRAAAAVELARGLDRDGFRPDVIIGHPGWGETIHLKEVWPDARVILFAELWYRTHGGDVGFDPEFPNSAVDAEGKIHAKNATGALAYVMADRIIAPTGFQASTFPPALRRRIEVAHEGLDLSRARRRDGVRLRLAGGRVLDGSRPVITFVARTLEPIRGFHVLLRALPAFLAACPEAEVVVMGGEKGGYGAHAPEGRSWKETLLAAAPAFDPGRVHFLGTVSHATMIEAFSLSWAHIYLTYPFTLSWSLVEAMACECLVIGSDTAPVRDAISDGVDGVLVDFFDHAALAAALADAVRRPDAYAGLRRAARETALARFSKEQGVAAWLAAIDGRPAPCEDGAGPIR